MSQAVDELWRIVQTLSLIDARMLVEAVERAVASGEELDYRSHLLIRDSLRALDACWGLGRFHRWFTDCPQRARIEVICDPNNFDSDPEEIGFPTLMTRVVRRTIRQMLAPIRTTSSSASFSVGTEMTGDICLR